MEIPDCYDPERQAVRREAALDKYVKSRPVCILCRKVLTTGDLFGTTGCTVVCLSCVEELNRNIEIVEE